MNNPASHSTATIRYCQPAGMGERMWCFWYINGLAMRKQAGDNVKRRGSNGPWCSGPKAGIKTHTHTHTPGGSAEWLVSTQLSPCPVFLLLLLLLLKVCVSNILLLLERRDRKSPRDVHKQPHPECYSETGSASWEEEGRWTTEVFPLLTHQLRSINSFKSCAECFTVEWTNLKINLSGC